VRTIRLNLSCGRRGETAGAPQCKTLERHHDLDRPLRVVVFSCPWILGPGSAARPPLRRSGWIGWCWQLEPSTASAGGRDGRAAGVSAGTAAPRASAPGSQGGLGSTPSTKTRWPPVGTTPATAPPPRPRGCRPVGRRPGRSGSSACRERIELASAVVAWRGRRRKGPLPTPCWSS